MSKFLSIGCKLYRLPPASVFREFQQKDREIAQAVLASGELNPEEKERRLLEKISLGIPVATWKRYNYLKALRDNAQLGPEEHTELMVGLL